MQYNIEQRKIIGAESEKRSLFKKIALAVLILILMAVSFGAGIYLPGRYEVMKDLAKKETVYLGKVLGKYSQPKPGVLAQDVNFNLFWDVWDTLKREYVDKEKLNEKEMFYGSLKGMVGSTGDPYTVFMDPKSSQEFAESFTGSFEGIGAEIGIRNEIVTIISPLAGSPAEKAGLKAGDKIYAINGESTAGFSIEEAVRKIRGPQGTQVTLTISRDGMEKAKDVVIKRDVTPYNHPINYCP